MRRPLLGAVMVLAALGSHAAADEPCFTQLQVLGTHNSYHQAPPRELKALWQSTPELATAAESWEYEHPPLRAQLDAGVRALELDVHWDPEGGLYSVAASLRLAGRDGRLRSAALGRPGFKVLHIADVDFRTSCEAFVDCLEEVRAWSKEHPTHLPIVVYVELKDQPEVAQTLGAAGVAVVETLLRASSAPGPDALVVPAPIDRGALQALEAEILDVFPRSALVTPDSVRRATGAGRDLAAALLKDPLRGECGWPPLADMRGKVLFVALFSGQAQLDAYTGLHPDGAGALLWTEGSAPGAVFYEATGADLPLLSAAEAVAALQREFVAQIDAKVRAGYIVRARADVNTREARANFTTRYIVLAAAGVQHLATDFLAPSDIFPSTYEVSLLAGQAAVCVNGRNTFCEASGSTFAVPACVRDPATPCSVLEPGIATSGAARAARAAGLGAAAAAVAAAAAAAAAVAGAVFL